MKENSFKNILLLGLLVGILVLSFLLIKPILMAIITGFILAFIFMPVYRKLLHYLKSPNASSLIICIVLLAIIIFSLWFLVPVGINQAVKVYFASRNFDFVTPLKSIFPSVFQSNSLAVDVGNAISNFMVSFTDKLVQYFSNFLLELPSLTLQLIVVFFTLFFVLRDKEKLSEFLKSFSPFSKDVEKRLIKSSSSITSSILYGQVIIGLVQGLVAGAGFFIFGVPNAFLFTLLAVLAGVFPIIGTAFVWVPVAIYALVNMSFFKVVGILFFGFLSIISGHILRPMIVSRKTKVHSSIVLIGMIGGVFYFGILGFILGPLILSYLLILLEGYQFKKRKSKFFIEESKENFSLMKLIR